PLPTAHVPELPEIGRQLQSEFDPIRLDRPGQRRVEIVRLDLQPVQPERLVRTVQRRRRRRRQRHAPLRLSLPHRRRLAACRQFLVAEFANRLVQRKPRLPIRLPLGIERPYQTLFHQRLDPLQHRGGQGVRRTARLPPCLPAHLPPSTHELRCLDRKPT